MTSTQTSPLPVSLTLEQALVQAIAQHQAGHIQVAEQLYRAILQAQPSHPEANHMLGVLAMQLGQTAVGLPHFKTAVACEPPQGQYWLSYLDALLQAGQADLASQELAQGRQRGLSGAAIEALADLLPGAQAHSEVHLPRGAGPQLKKKSSRPTTGNRPATPPVLEIDQMLSLFNAGRYLEASELAQRVTTRFPHDGFSWKLLGAALRKMGQRESALAAMRQAVAWLPNDAEAHNNLGNTLRDMGQAEHAKTSLVRALKLRPDYAEAHNNLGIVFQDLGRLNDAETCFRRAFALRPELAEAYNNLGNTLRSLGRAAEAEKHLRRAVQIRPDYAQAHCNLGAALQELGQPQPALACFERALALQPGMAEVHNNLGIALQSLDRHAEAEASFLRALALRADYAQAYYNLGLTLQAQAKYDEAADRFLRAITLQPDHAQAYYNLGNTLRTLGRDREAEAYLRSALAIKPDYVEACNNLGSTLRDLGRSDEAETVFRQALSMAPDFDEAYSNLGVALWDLGRLDEAEAAYRRALALNPGNTAARSNLGSVLMDSGKLNEAETLLVDAIAQAPDSARTLANALLILPYRKDDARFSQLETLYARRGSLERVERIKLNFAMGRAMEQSADYARAFAAYEEGNRLHYQRHPFNEAEHARALETTTAFYNVQRLSQYQALADALPEAEYARVPIFIVGMPRSGTTLIEQILASHPSVYGAGELPLMASLARKADQLLHAEPSPERALAALRQLGRDYLDQVWRLAPLASHISDKMPENFYFLALIHLMLPQAKIIHAMRAPLDTCFSCFSIFFRYGHEFSYDQQTLGRFYLGYEKLMRHWHQVLPAGRIVDVVYEDMVADHEREARRLLDALGLPWHAACLDFHTTERTVHTASVLQVRQPIYSSSVARWRRFAPYLAPLRAIISV